MKLSDNTNVALPLRNLFAIIGTVAIGAWFATRNMDMNDKQLMCGQVKAIMEKNVDGSESIKKIIIESK